MTRLADSSFAPRARYSGILIASLVVGVVAGVGAVVFRGLIALVHNLAFSGRTDITYDTARHTALSPLGAWIILVPVAGALVVTYLVRKFAPEAKGHGVPEVMDAVYYQEGRIRPVVAAVKSVASAVSIGTGGSVGREGPIVQIGAAFGSLVGQIFHMTAGQRSTLVAAGAAGGIAATFNTPLAGILFAVELMLASVTAATLLPVALATVVATIIGRVAFGLAPAFDVPALQAPELHVHGPLALLPYVVFAVFAGALAALFVRGLYWFEDRFDAMPGNDYTRHALGMLLVGGIIYALARTTGQYSVQGVGYATIGDLLRGDLNAPVLILVLCAAKLLATWLTLGSGASGGIFSPGLFMGATAGTGFALLAGQLFPQLSISPASFAVVGMAAVVAGSTGLLITVNVMVFEMTLDYNLILPSILAVAIACYVRKRLSPESVYTLKLARRGHVVHEGIQAAVDVALRAGDLARTDFVVRGGGEAADGPALADLTSGDGVIVVDADGAIGGVVSADTALEGGTTLREVADTRFLVVFEDSLWVDVLGAMDEDKARVALVLRSGSTPEPDAVVGVLTHRDIVRQAQRMAGLLRTG